MFPVNFVFFFHLPRLFTSGGRPFPPPRFGALSLLYMIDNTTIGIYNAASKRTLAAGIKSRTRVLFLKAPTFLWAFLHIRCERMQRDKPRARQCAADPYRAEADSDRSDMFLFTLSRLRSLRREGGKIPRYRPDRRLRRTRAGWPCCCRRRKSPPSGRCFRRRPDR